jgi:adenine-specific DNA-methyltransferase
MNNGTFTHIFHPNKVLYNDKLLHITNSMGLITFNEEENNNEFMFKDYFNIYVGLVSGKEEVYKNKELGNIIVLNGENKNNKYIYIKKFPCENEKINNYLLNYKKELIERKIKKFNENNWFEWGAPRNITSIENNLNKNCIYIYNLTRKENVSFLGKINYFGGNLIMLMPKKNCDLDKIISYLNSNTFKDNFIFSGRFKIGHRQISNSYIPKKYL